MRNAESGVVTEHDKCSFATARVVWLLSCLVDLVRSRQKFVGDKAIEKNEQIFNQIYKKKCFFSKCKFLK